MVLSFDHFAVVPNLTMNPRVVTSDAGDELEWQSISIRNSHVLTFQSSLVNM